MPHPPLSCFLHAEAPATHTLQARGTKKPVCFECAVNVAEEHAFYSLDPIVDAAAWHRAAAAQAQRHAYENPHLVDDYSDADPGL